MLPEMEKREEKDQSYPVTPTGRPVVGLRSGPAAVPARTGSFTRRELTQGERGAHDLALDPEREREREREIFSGTREGRPIVSAVVHLHRVGAVRGARCALAALPECSVRRGSAGLTNQGSITRTATAPVQKVLGG